MPALVYVLVFFIDVVQEPLELLSGPWHSHVIDFGRWTVLHPSTAQGKFAVILSTLCDEVFELLIRKGPNGPCDVYVNAPYCWHTALVTLPQKRTLLAVMPTKSNARLGSSLLPVIDAAIQANRDLKHEQILFDDLTTLTGEACFLGKVGSA